LILLERAKGIGNCADHKLFAPATAKRLDQLHGGGEPASIQSEATTQRKQRDAQVTSITDRRMAIQFAADAEWPFSVDANAG